MKYNLKIIFTISILISLICGCVNPMVAMEPEIKRFKKDRPDQIQTFKGTNRTMRYASSGDPSKRAILFVHGSPGSWDAWTHFLLDPELQKKFHLIAIDRPGFGGSGPGVAVPSLFIQAQDVAEVLKFNHSQKRAILIGHSFGGPVIGRIAVDYPEKVAGLIFVASSVSPDLETTKWYQYPASWPPFRWIIPSALRVCNEEILPLKQELTLLLPHWKEIKAKSYIIQGEQDDLVPPGNVDFLVEHLDPKKIIKVVREPKLNHFVPWKRPDLIFEAIRQVDESL